MKTLEQIIQPNSKILVVIAHPDDMEGYFGGTLIHLINNNIVNPEYIYLLLATDGGRGGRDKHDNSNKLKSIRLTEQKEALKYLKIPERNFFPLNLEDGFLHNNENFLIKQIVHYVRKVKLDIIFTHNGLELVQQKKNGIQMIHKDHRILGLAVMDCLYPYTRDKLFFPEFIESDFTDSSFPRKLLISEFSEPDIEFNYSDIILKKIELLRIFSSQFDNDVIIKKMLDRMDGEIDNQYIERFKFIEIIN